LDQIARLLGFEMKRHRSGWWFRLGRSRIAGDEGEAALTGPEAVAMKDFEDTRSRGLELTEGVGLGQLGCQPPRPQAGVGEREGDDLAFDPLWELVRHSRPPTFSRTQDLQAIAGDLITPAVVGRAMDLEVSASPGDPDLLGMREQRDAIQVEPIILSHGDPSCVA
jgi:hypothetical protein